MNEAAVRRLDLGGGLTCGIPTETNVSYAWLSLRPAVDAHYVVNVGVLGSYVEMGIMCRGVVVAQLLFPLLRVVAVTGDGGFLMNSQELETAVRLQLQHVIFVWRDDGYGVIRWKQMLRFGRTSSMEFDKPDLVVYA